VDGRPDDLLEEPLYMNGVLIRRWDELAELPRDDAAGAPPRRAGRGWLRIPGDVPAPRPPQTLRWERQPAGD
jgi:hypothetical protein